MEFEAVIGLEVHAELNTESKMYCRCKNAFGGEANTRVCPICTGFPGTLPNVNREAVNKAILAGRMMNCHIAKYTRQYRKHYRYPDLPKGYQISQFEVPLCENGYFEYYCGEKLLRAEIIQIHIEEDAGKLVHSDGKTYVDYNRCGVPLIEIVTAPCFHSADEAVAFLEAVRTMLLDLGISDCRMEEGSLRADVNVSLRRKGDTRLNARVEMKNLATFSGARRAIIYEIARQESIYKAEQTVRQMTCKWDDEHGVTITMRDKENARDYRFMPEPDIPCIEISFENTQLPKSEAHRKKWLSEFIPFAQASEIARDLKLFEYFEKLLAMGADAKISANWVLGHIAALVNENGNEVYNSPLTQEKLFGVLTLLSNKKITTDGAKHVISELFISGGEAEEIVLRRKLMVLDDMQIYDGISDAVIADNPKAVSDYLSGKESVIGFLTGQCMRRAGAAADATRFHDSICKKLRGYKTCQ